MTKRLILTCMMGLAMLGAPLSVNAQGAAKAGSKLIKLFTKTGAKSGGKAASKAGAAAANDARAASKTGKYASETERNKTARPITVTCSKCHGSGHVSTWNSYYGYYQTTTCSKCNGRGKVTRIIRY